MERIQKVLAARGVASRRKAEELIVAGKVKVNGVTALLGQSVSSGDLIEVNGRQMVTAGRVVYLALNKPPGFVTSLRSTHGERTVAELINVPERVFPVGRLDKETSGLLFLTNDGDWANLVTHPRYEMEKEYDVIVRGTAGIEALRRLREGVELPGGEVTAPAVVEKAAGQGDHTRLSVTVIEGKKRQIRLMAAAVGHPVLALRRVRIGPIPLVDLEEGRYRNLRPEEVETIRAHAGLVTRGRSRALAADHD